MPFCPSMEKRAARSPGALQCLCQDCHSVSVFGTLMVLSPLALARTSKIISKGSGDRELSSGSSHVPVSPWKYGDLVGHGDFRGGLLALLEPELDLGVEGRQAWYLVIEAGVLPAHLN